MKTRGNNHKTDTDSRSETQTDKSKTLSITCASGKVTSKMLGWPRGSPFSSLEKMTWYPRIWPCCFPCSGGFQVTRMAVELIASTSNFLGGAPGTENQRKAGHGENPVLHTDTAASLLRGQLLHGCGFRQRDSFLETHSGGVLHNMLTVSNVENNLVVWTPLWQHVGMYVANQCCHEDQRHSGTTGVRSPPEDSPRTHDLCVKISLDFELNKEQIFDMDNLKWLLLDGWNMGNYKQMCQWK